jgi:hypothetical protein
MRTAPSCSMVLYLVYIPFPPLQPFPASFWNCSSLHPLQPGVCRTAHLFTPCPELPVRISQGKPLHLTVPAVKEDAKRSLIII